MRAWIDVATLVKTKSLKGRFVAQAAAGLPFLLEEGMEVAFVPPQTDLPRRGVVVFVDESCGDSCEIGFDSIDNEQIAHNLVGCHCLIRREHVSEIKRAGTTAWADWSGWTVIDEQGETLGLVEALIENPAHPLLELNRGQEVENALIPLVDEFIVEIDEERRTIRTKLPDGLLDL